VRYNKPFGVLAGRCGNSFIWFVIWESMSRIVLRGRWYNGSVKKMWDDVCGRKESILMLFKTGTS
jgi:hypothetical protein